MLKKIGSLGWKIDFTRKGFEYRFRLTHLEIAKTQTIKCKLYFHETEMDAEYNRETKTFTFDEIILSRLEKSAISKLKCPKETAVRIETYIEDLIEAERRKNKKS